MEHNADKTLETCRQTREVAEKALVWIEDNADAQRLERSALIKEFRNHIIKSQKLEAALLRPMCVGVFGASQAGK